MIHEAVKAKENDLAIIVSVLRFFTMIYWYLMDLEIVKEKYKGKFYPIGNVNNKTTMVTDSPKDVKAEVLECLKIAAPGGGYILATDHSLHDDIPSENIYTLIEAADSLGFTL